VPVTSRRDVARRETASHVESKFVLLALSLVGVARTSSDGSFSVRYSNEATFPFGAAQMRDAESIYHSACAIVQRDLQGVLVNCTRASRSPLAQNAMRSTLCAQRATRSGRQSGARWCSQKGGRISDQPEPNKRHNQRNGYSGSATATPRLMSRGQGKVLQPIIASRGRE